MTKSVDLHSHLSAVSAHISELERALERANQKIEQLEMELHSARDQSWAQRLLDAYRVKKGSNLYRTLFEALPPEVRVRGRMSPYLLALYSEELPPGLTFADLQKRKAAGELTVSQAEIYDAINTFKASCSYGKWLI